MPTPPPREPRERSSAAAAEAAGLLDDALRYAERTSAERDPLVVWGRRGTPFWDVLRAHPCFADLARALSWT